MIRKLLTQELDMALFADFHRHQVVNQCWRKINEEWGMVSFRENHPITHFRGGTQAAPYGKN